MSHAGGLFRELLAHRKIDEDDENNAIVDAFADALGDSFETLVSIAYGNEEGTTRPLQTLRDPSVADLDLLPHAALYTGALLPARNAGESDEDYLERARAAASALRNVGSYQAIRETAEPLLTGTKNVYVMVDPLDPYTVLVRTRVAETPDPAAVEAAIEGDYVSGGRRGVLRAELGLNYAAADGVSWNETTITWGAVSDDTTWATATVEAMN